MHRRYTVQQAAERLGISTATLRFWEESFHELLHVPRGSNGELEFSDEHLALIGRIQRRVLSEGAPLDEVRRELAGREPRPADSEPSQDTGPSRETEPRPADSEPARALDSSRDSALSQIEDLRRAIDALGARIEEVESNVSFLLEENQALQRLLGEVVEHVDRLVAGMPQAAADTSADEKTTATAPRNASAQASAPRHAVVDDFESSALRTTTPGGAAEPAAEIQPRRVFPHGRDALRIPAVRPWSPKTLHGSRLVRRRLR